jgi:hypothetical protein
MATGENAKVVNVSIYCRWDLSIKLMRRPHSFLAFPFYALPPDWLNISSLCYLIIRVEQIKRVNHRGNHRRVNRSEVHIRNLL